MRLLIKLASRSRPEKLIDVVKCYIKLSTNLTKTRFLISLDTDDTTVTEQLKSTLYSVHPCIQICMGTSKSKIDAMNRDIPSPSTFDILLLASDDMVPEVMGYDEIIRQNMKKFYPNTDGVLWFNDGYRGKTLNTLCILGSRYYQRFGYIYYPGYKSFYCDNEFTDVSIRLKKQTYFPNVIIRHKHPANTTVTLDALYIRNITYADEDKHLYDRRKWKKPLKFLNTHR